MSLDLSQDPLVIPSRDDTPVSLPSFPDITSDDDDDENKEPPLVIPQIDFHDDDDDDDDGNKEPPLVIPHIDFHDDDDDPFNPAPIPPPHPNTLVAIATARIAHNETCDATRVNAELGASVPAKFSRFVLVLDALASLAVSSIKGQVVAMAMQTDDKGVCVLTFAQNGAVKVGLQGYLKLQLARLRGIAEAKEADRPPLELEFVKASYVHSILKLNKRFTDREWLAPFDVVFAKRKNEDAVKCQVLLSALLTEWEAVQKLKAAHKIKNDATNKTHKNMDLAGVVEDRDWTRLMFMMSTSIDGNLQHILQRAPLCEQWATEHQKDVTTTASAGGLAIRVPLHRAIEKLTSHYRHILLLLSYAKSTEGGRDLAGEIPVNELPPGGAMPTVVVPNVAGMESALRPHMPPGQNLDNEIIAITPQMNVQLNPLVYHVGTGVSFPGVVHCECAMIDHFGAEPHDEGWPVTYIGVSKLSCAACYAWIRAFNATHKVQYHTRGCHGRWYPRWAMPPPPVNMTAERTKVETALNARMLEFVGQAYRSFYDAGINTRVILLSDSTESKARLPGHAWNSMELAEAIRLSRLKRQDRAITQEIQRKALEDAKKNPPK